MHQAVDVMPQKDMPDVVFSPESGLAAMPIEQDVQ
jgi:hypothetical protein